MPLVVALLSLLLSGTPARAAAPSLGDYLRTCGIGDKDFARFSDDRQMADEELDVVCRIAFRLRDCPADALRRMMAHESEPVPADGKYRRGRTMRLRGRIESIETAETLSGAAAEPLWRCTLVSETTPRRAVVYVGQIGNRPHTGEQVAVDAVFVKYVPGVQDRPLPVVAAGRLQRRPAGPLAELDFDAELLDGVLDRGPLAAADSAAFYRLLALTKPADSARLRREAGALDPVAAAGLFGDPAAERGRLFRVTGIARRAARVPINDPAAAAQLGADHYFEIHLLADDLQDNPLAFCTLELPQGMPLGGPPLYSQPIEVTGFFLKMWQYPTGMTAVERAEHPGSSAAWQAAPLLVGPPPDWKPAPALRKDGFDWLAGGILALAMTGLGLLLWSLRQSDQEFSCYVRRAFRLD
jgi:hypothetical protein